MSIRDHSDEARPWRYHLAVAGMVGLLGWLVAVDVARLQRAIETIGSTPALWGSFAALCTAAWLGALAIGRRRATREQASIRTCMVIVWLIGVVIALIGTHRRHWSEPDGGDLTNATEVGLVTYLVVIIVAAVIGAGLLLWWERRADRPIVHKADDLVEVWRVEPPTGDRRRRPYLEARCECGWTGQHIYETTPEARSKAFAIAHRHGARVAADVLRG